MPIIIDRFTGPYRFLSNFWTDENGLCVEYLYQADKATNEIDRQYVLSSVSPGEAKRRGRSIKKRPGFDEERPKTILYFNRLKYKNLYLKQKLLDTKDAILIEGNTWHDNYFGSCFCIKCKQEPKLNILGNILMQIREEIKNDN